MKQNTLLLVGVFGILLVLVVGGGAGAYLLLRPTDEGSTTATQPAPAVQPTPTPSPTPTATSTPTTQPEAESENTVQPEPELNGPDIPASWLRYENTEHGFSISHPSSYEALDDATNLYGWPNGVVLLYGGGQAYDVVVESWNTEAEYMAKYPDTSNLTVKRLNGKIITIFDQTNDPQNELIIATFTPLE